MTKRHLRTIRALILSTLTIAGFIAMTPSPTEAAGLQILPTKTTVASSANPAFDGAPITYSANVTILNTNLGPITPKGTVTFQREGLDDTTVTLGTVPLSSCIILLSKCTASVTETPIAAGAEGYLQHFRVTATYHGDTLSKPSSGFVDELLGYPHDCNTADEMACTSFMVSANGTTGLEVTVPQQDGPATDYQIKIGFESAPLGCTTAGTGDTAVYDVDLPAGQGKMVDHVSYGAAAEKGKPNPDRICWQADSAFAGSTPIGGGKFEGLLPLCGDGDNPPPCVESSWYLPPAPSEGGTLPSELHTYIATPPGDPKSTR
jgi:hypothetical protein